VQSTSIPGIAMYSRWQTDRGVYFNSYFIEAEGGNLLVDPLPADQSDLDAMTAAGGVAWIAVTNRDHERASSELAARFGARVAAGAADASDLSRAPDRLLRDGDEIGPARVIALDGLKTAGEFALYLAATRTVISGDALWGDPVGELRMMPDEKLADPTVAARSLCRLREVRPRNLLVGDGAPIFGHAYEAINACLEKRDGAEVNRINLDELNLEVSSGPANFTVELAEIGFRIGAEKLGYWTTRIGPGGVFCPTHWHTAEEELFIVWEGTPTIESPHGSMRLRPGDFVAFPARPFGAHKLVNHSETAATIVLISNVSPHDVCFYPDSKKLLVEATDTLVRSEPQLDYFDGEV
jgi:uncharacterized cupin superfamily protein